MRGSYKNIHPFSKLAITTLVALLSIFVFMILAAVVAIPFFGMDAFSDLLSSSISFEKENLDILRFFQIMQSVGLFIIPTLIAAYLFSSNTRKYLAISKKPLVLSSIIASLIIFTAGPFINWIGMLNAKMTFPDWLSDVELWMKSSEASAKVITELFVKTDSIGGLLFNIFMIGLIPAIGEEFLFRGVIQKTLLSLTKNKHSAIWITAVIFSALHLQFYGFIPRAILGAMFGYMLVWSGNLWLPIIAHFINNSAAVIAYYLYHNGNLSIDPDTIGTNSEYGIAAIISSIIVCGLFILLRKIENQRSSLD